MNRIPANLTRFISFLVLILNTCCSRTEHGKYAALNFSPAGKNSSLPHLTTGPDSTVILSWIEQRDSTAVFYYATGNQQGWNKPVEIDSSSKWFINWADYPSVTIGANGDYAAHVLKYNGKGTFEYDVQMYTNTGQTWNKFLLNTDGIPAEHGFVSIVPYDSNFFVSWLDGRNAPSMGNNDGHSGHHGSMSLRAAIISNSGERIKDWEVDPRTCDCCQTTSVITAAGPVIFYRDRSESEVRDIAVSRLISGSWTEPKRIHEDNWMIHGCPVNGPRAVAFGETVAVIWYSESDNAPAVYFSSSKDNGSTFDEPIRVDTGNPTGRADITGITENEFMVSWMQDGKIMARVVNESGITGEPVIIAEISEARSSGFPQITSTSDLIVFAWTDAASGQIKTKALSRKDFKP